MQDYFDLPFYYVQDFSGFVDGQSYDGLSLPIDRDAEFRLRAVFGIDLVCTGGLYFYDGSGRPATPGGFIHPGNQPLLIQPEIVYPPAGQIRFNVRTVSRASYSYANPATRAYYSRLVFAGVKRFTGSAARNMLDYHKSRSDYRHQPYIRTGDLEVTVTSHVPPYPSTQLRPPFTSRIEIDNHDFDLFSLLASPPLAGNKLLIMPYDAAGRQLASDFIPSAFLAWQVHRPWACFPNTTLLYVSNSSIRFDWMSLYTDLDTLPATVHFSFSGARRIPC